MNTPCAPRFWTPVAMLLAFFVAMHAAASAAELHVAKTGNDANSGTAALPLCTIQHAAELAQPGDVVTVHAGTYRERINPPRGGTSPSQRIVYQAAPGEKVEIKGSEVVRNWVRDRGDVWKATLPNAMFGGFNPYSDLIRGDWFDPRGREHHTGAVYLDGQWLTEAAKLDDVFAPPGATAEPAPGPRYLINVAWLRAGKTDGAKISAASFNAHHGTQNAPCSEGGLCVGFIEHGHWLRYDKVDFGPGADRIEFRVAAASEGGVIEVHLDRADGPLLGSAVVPCTGDWQSWTSVVARIRHVSGEKSVCLTFKRHPEDPMNEGSWSTNLWYGRVDASHTTLWAQFPGVNPNQRCVEINVRRTVFYPDQPGRNYITLRGFVLRHAATPWAPPTAEQIGLVGTHWSKGWIIENNVVSHSICSGIALGKHGDPFDNTSANTAEGYVKTIERGLARGWNRDTIGHHIVRNNVISNCEQAGVVGSLGAAFSVVTGNTIHDIHIRRLFSGAEMAGIKFHAAIDTVIQGNHIYRTCRGLWLDWMAQGTRVSGNLFHHNFDQDLFVEVDHGPFVADNNLFLSAMSLLDMSEGGAYVHNLFVGTINTSPEPNRETPYHPAHSTTVAGLARIKGGDDRFLNNLFVGHGKTVNGRPKASPQPVWTAGCGLWMYDLREYPLQTGGNVYYFGAWPYVNERDAVVLPEVNPGVKLDRNGDHFRLHITIGPELTQAATAPVTTARLGKAKIPGTAYENADGSPLTVATDFFGKRRGDHPTPGPFETPGVGELILNVR